MKFLYPQFLWALLLLAIPIIIHLFNFRRYKVIYFSNISFLKEVNEETKRQSKLKHILVLLARLLAIASLVIAFAFPYIPSNNAKSGQVNTNTVGIYIDNSKSMEGLGKEGHLIEAGKNRALEILEAYPATTKFQLITSDFEGRQQHFYSKDEITDQIININTSYNRRDFSEVVERHKDATGINQSTLSDLYFLSDFQKSTLNLKPFNDSSIQVKLLPLLPENSSNIYIDSVWFDDPVRKLNTTEQLNIDIKNVSPKTLEVKVTLSMNNEKSFNTYSIPSDTTTTVQFEYTSTSPGFQEGVLSISNYGDMEYLFDDTYFLSYHIPEQINILEICESEMDPGYIEKVFANDAYYNYKKSTRLTLKFQDWDSLHIIYLNGLKKLESGLQQELINFVQGGGSVFIAPSEKANIDSYNQFLSTIKLPTILSLDTATTKGGKLHHQESFFNNVFAKEPDDRIALPVFTKTFKTSSNTINYHTPLLDLVNNQTILFMGSQLKGNTYFLGSPLDASSNTFMKNGLFVPIILRMAELSGKPQPVSFTISNNGMAHLPKLNLKTEKTYTITSKEDSDFSFIPSINESSMGTSIAYHNQIKDPGIYYLKQATDTIAALAFNAPQSESDTKHYSLEELSNWVTQSQNITLFELSADKKISSVIKEQQEGIQLWWYALLAALLFILIEIVFLRLLKS